MKTNIKLAFYWLRHITNKESRLNEVNVAADADWATKLWNLSAHSDQLKCVHLYGFTGSKRLFQRLTGTDDFDNKSEHVKMLNCIRFYDHEYEIHVPGRGNRPVWLAARPEFSASDWGGYYTLRERGMNLTTGSAADIVLGLFDDCNMVVGALNVIELKYNQVINVTENNWDGDNLEPEFPSAKRRRVDRYISISATVTDGDAPVAHWHRMQCVHYAAHWALPTTLTMMGTNTTRFAHFAMLNYSPKPASYCCAVRASLEIPEKIGEFRTARYLDECHQPENSYSDDWVLFSMADVLARLIEDAVVRSGRVLCALPPTQELSIYHSRLPTFHCMEKYKEPIQWLPPFTGTSLKIITH